MLINSLRSICICRRRHQQLVHFHHGLRYYNGIHYICRAPTAPGMKWSPISNRYSHGTIHRYSTPFAIRAPRPATHIYIYTFSTLRSHSVSTAAVLKIVDSNPGPALSLCLSLSHTHTSEMVYFRKTQSTLLQKPQ